MRESVRPTRQSMTDEDQDGDDGEGDEDVADGVGRCGLGEHAEGGAGVEDVGDAEDVRDDGVGPAGGSCWTTMSFVRRSSRMTAAEIASSEARVDRGLRRSMVRWFRRSSCSLRTSGLLLRCGAGWCVVGREVDGFEGVGAAQADGGVVCFVAYVGGEAPAAFALAACGRLGLDVEGSL